MKNKIFINIYMKWLYFGGHFPSFWYAAGSYIIRALIFEGIAFFGKKFEL